MNITTHALAPVVICHLAFGRQRWCDKYALIAIGIAGGLPDILSPHFSLEARVSSWSHGLPAWFGFSLIVFTLAALCPSFACNGRDIRFTLPRRLVRSFSFPLATAISAAYLFHLFCDAISGGINWLHPIRDWLWGDYWVDPIFWIPLDIFFALLTYYLFRIRRTSPSPERQS